MSWQEINSESKDTEKRIKEQKAKASELAKRYSRVFESEDGQKVLEHLNQLFIYANDIPFNAENINYQAAYRNGEAGVIKFIINQISKAKTL